MQEQNGEKNRLWSELSQLWQDIDSGCNIKHNRAENQINGENPIKNWLHISSFRETPAIKSRMLPFQLVSQATMLGSAVSTCRSPIGLGRGDSPNCLPGSPSRTGKVNSRQMSDCIYLLSLKRRIYWSCSSYHTSTS